MLEFSQGVGNPAPDLKSFSKYADKAPAPARRVKDMCNVLVVHFASPPEESLYTPPNPNSGTPLNLESYPIKALRIVLCVLARGCRQALRGLMLPSKAHTAVCQKPHIGGCRVVPS